MSLLIGHQSFVEVFLCTFIQLDGGSGGGATVGM